MFIIVIEALVIMVIVASTIGPMAVALLGGCFCALIGHLVSRVLILDEKRIESSLIRNQHSQLDLSYFSI